MKKFHIHTLSRNAYTHTVVWAVVISLAIVVSAAFLGRGMKNFKAALVEKPDLALYLLLPEEEIGQSTLIKEEEFERSYLAETKDGPKLVILKKGEKQWYVALIENLHE